MSLQTLKFPFLLGMFLKIVTMLSRPKISISTVYAQYYHKNLIRIQYETIRDFSHQIYITVQP